MYWLNPPVECELREDREFLPVPSSDVVPASRPVSGTVYPLCICWRNEWKVKSVNTYLSLDFTELCFFT